jgi:hypothetical protein
MSSKSWKASKKNRAESEEGLEGSQADTLKASSRLPFEPIQNRKKTNKNPIPSPTPESSKNSKNTSLEKAKPGKKQIEQQKASSRSAAIPEVVSKRMVRRIALFSGIPSLMGMLTFVISYIVVSQHYLKLPSVVVLLVSLGFFGLGVLGLSYGALSASWDEDRVGTWLGWSEFKVNFERTIASWREARQKTS